MRIKNQILRYSTRQLLNKAAGGRQLGFSQKRDYFPEHQKQTGLTWDHEQHRYYSSLKVVQQSPAPINLLDVEEDGIVIQAKNRSSLYTRNYVPEQDRSYSIEKKRQKKHRALARDLISLGVHLGHQRNVEALPVRPYILGYRHDFAIFDIRQSMWSLKRALNFLRQCSRRGATSVFYYGNLTHMDKTFRLFFTHMAQQEKQSLIDRGWEPGLLTNYNVACRDVLKILHRQYLTDTSIKPLSMLELFFRIIRYMHMSHNPTKTWNQHTQKMKKFWRFFLFFRVYQHFHKIPDVAFVINPRNNIVMLNELKLMKIPVVGVVDSNSVYNGISYPIFGNDDNPLIGLFYFQLYMNAYRLGRYDQYRTLQGTILSEPVPRLAASLLENFSQEMSDVQKKLDASDPNKKQD